MADPGLNQRCWPVGAESTPRLSKQGCCPKFAPICLALTGDCHQDIETVFAITAFIARVMLSAN